MHEAQSSETRQTQNEVKSHGDEAYKNKTIFTTCLECSYFTLISQRQLDTGGCDHVAGRTASSTRVKETLVSQETIKREGFSWRQTLKLRRKGKKGISTLKSYRLKFKQVEETSALSSTKWNEGTYLELKQLGHLCS